MGVCTNKPIRLSLELLDALGLTPMFDAVMGGDSLPVRKPDPGHLRGTLAAMGADGRRAVMVGDGRNDVAAARAAGMPVVLFSRGYAGGDPRALGADVVIDDFAELVPVLRGLLGQPASR
jgi:phosphoglycolate phosphatase